jgi:hypothetical protein
MRQFDSALLLRITLAVCRVRQLLVTANVSSSLILATLMMEVVHSSEMSVLARTTWHNIPEDGILYSIIYWHIT